jgi:hypothetical protein
MGIVASIISNGHRRVNRSVLPELTEGLPMGISPYTKKGVSPDPETSFRRMAEGRPTPYHIAAVDKS